MTVRTLIKHLQKLDKNQLKYLFFIQIFNFFVLTNFSIKIKNISFILYKRINSSAHLKVAASLIHFSFCVIDYKKNYKIENDKIVFSIDGKHILQIGYLYAENTEGGKLINYEENIFQKEDEEYYLYRVPLFINW